MPSESAAEANPAVPERNASALRIHREEPCVHPGRVDAVGVPSRRVRGDGDDLPPLVARQLRRTEVDADDHLDLERAAKETNGAMTLQFSPLPPPWSRAIRAAALAGIAPR